MKRYELIKDGKYYDYTYCGSLRQAREEFNHKWEGRYEIICTGNDWERKTVILK